MAYPLVERTTRIPVRGQVEIERPGGAFGRVSGDTIAGVGDCDRIGIGSDASATVTYVDESTTAIEPSTTIQLTRLGNLTGGVRSTSLRQESGLTWRRALRRSSVAASHPRLGCLRRQTTGRSASISTERSPHSSLMIGAAASARYSR